KEVSSPGGADGGAVSKGGNALGTILRDGASRLLRMRSESLGATRRAKDSARRRENTMQIATDAVASWSATRPEIAGEFQRDADAHSKFWRKGADLLAALPEKLSRNPAEARAAETILRTGRESREAFLGRHAEAVYRALTKDMTICVRAEPLAYEAASLVPGLTPTRKEV